MTSLKNKKVLITGGMGGIGAPLCDLLENSGAELLIVDRQSREDTIYADLSSKTSLNTLCQQIQDTPIDILINLAGLMYFGKTEKQTPQNTEDLIQVNLESPIRLTQSVIPGMLKRGNGHIVNIGSVFGSLPFPFFSVYSATKSGLKSFSQAIRREYQSKGIIVTHVSPRAVKTNFNNTEIQNLHAKTKIVPDNPSWVAQQIFSAIVLQKANVTIGLPETFFSYVNALFPSLIDYGIAKSKNISEQLLNPS